jgi:Mg-chelatase subunit ChlD
MLSLSSFVRIVLLLIGPSLLLSAQQTPDCLKRLLIVNVRDQTGRLVSDLNPSSFRASLQGQQVRIPSATVRTGQRRVVLLLDASGSVNKENHMLDAARLIAGNLLLKAPAELHLALVVFSDHIVDTIDFTHPPSEIVLRLAGLEEGRGRTAILDALAYSATLLGPNLPGDAVYLISDGADNASHVRLRDVKAEFLARGIRIFAARLPGSRYFPTEEERAGPVLLEDLTNTTGGAIVEFDGSPSARDREHLRGVLDHEYDQMAHFYELEVEFQSGLKQERRLGLEIVDEHGKKRKDIQMFYPQKLLPCLVDPK